MIGFFFLFFFKNHIQQTLNIQSQEKMPESINHIFLLFPFDYCYKHNVIVINITFRLLVLRLSSGALQCKSKNDKGTQSVESRNHLCHKEQWHLRNGINKKKNLNVKYSFFNC